MERWVPGSGWFTQPDALFECDPATGDLTVSWIGNAGDVMKSLDVRVP